MARKKMECTKEYCVPAMCKFTFLLSIVCLVLFIIFCVKDLKPHLEAKDYKPTTCTIMEKNLDAGTMTCSCGRRCIDTDVSCAAIMVNVSATGVKARLREDETVTSKTCSDGCGWKYRAQEFLDSFPGIGGTVSCYYDPDDTSKVINIHESYTFILAAVLTPMCLYVLLTITCCSLFWCGVRKQGLSVSSGDMSSINYNRFNNTV